MLTAWDTLNATRLVLPDVTAREELECVRQRARDGELHCPACADLLWLKAGQIRIPHFAHRAVTHCAFAGASAVVLAARLLLYRFFQQRVQSGRLKGDLELEPHLPGLPAKPCIDLLLRRESEPPVAIAILASGLQPDNRWAATSAFRRAELVFRPVFLIQRLRRDPDTRDVYLLDTTQRDFFHPSPYGAQVFGGDAAPSLHFIDTSAQTWVTLRALRCVNPPQGFAAETKTSSLAELLWSERHAEWVHPGEAEALSAYRAQMRKVPPVWTPPLLPQVFKTLPAYLHTGLVCCGCGIRTTDWQTAQPSNDVCVCRTCFAAGRRLP